MNSQLASLNLTPVERTALANCTYPPRLRFLKCHQHGCHKQVDWDTNTEFCYWCWREWINCVEWKEVA